MSSPSTCGPSRKIPAFLVIAVPGKFIFHHIDVQEPFSEVESGYSTQCQDFSHNFQLKFLLLLQVLSALL